MTDASKSSDPALLVSYIDKIANAQTSLQELQREIGRLRQDSRADGFNMEALHQLGQILAKSPHDNGLGLLTDILQYARRTGIAVDTIQVEQSAPDLVRDQNNQRESFDVSHFMTTSQFVGERLSLLIQFALGIVVAGSLIWLVH